MTVALAQIEQAAPLWHALLKVPSQLLREEVVGHQPVGDLAFGKDVG